MAVEGMPRKTHRPKEIVAKLRQLDLSLSQGQSVAEAVRAIGMIQFACYQWHQEFGGRTTDRVARLKGRE